MVDGNSRFIMLNIGYDNIETKNYKVTLRQSYNTPTDDQIY